VPEDVGCGDSSDLVDFRISNLCVSYIRLRFDPPPGTMLKLIYNQMFAETQDRLCPNCAQLSPYRYRLVTI
jgi:hypothetical protein